eukprot:scaffold38552_cov30-Tisochrysis_lutea.AAC.8
MRARRKGGCPNRYIWGPRHRHEGRPFALQYQVRLLFPTPSWSCGERGTSCCFRPPRILERSLRDGIARPRLRNAMR